MMEATSWMETGPPPVCCLLGGPALPLLHYLKKEGIGSNLDGLSSTVPLFASVMEQHQLSLPEKGLQMCC